jgi:DNA helicase-2/ATP-dependent DNA helicase PcrA
MNYLNGLNEKQKEAVLHTNGPLLIVAGAGAGKTKTITHRIIHLIHLGIEPNKILAVTFTNKAAKEMKDRVTALLEKNEHGTKITEPEDRPFISTFHSLGVFIIKENSHLIGLNKYFNIIDENDSISIIKNIMKNRDIDPKQYEPRKIKSIISRSKGDFITVDIFSQEVKSAFQDVVAMIWRDYEAQFKKEKGLDFDDLLLESVLILKKYPQIKEYYQKKWQYIHIDEYQDTNEVQYEMTKLLVDKNKNICVVGDTDQCLRKGSKIKMADNTYNLIENVKKGDFILSNYGSGDFRPAKVVMKKSRLYKGNFVKIETRKGNVLISTPDHTHFAGYRLGITPQIYLNYLMYKKNIGWRIGTTSIQTKGQKRSMIGFIQRYNQEHADATWVIATHQTPQQARIQEYIFSLKYQLPTIPFTPRKGLSVNGYVHDVTALKEIFSSLNTEDGAHKLLSDLNLSREHPHHLPQNHNSNRVNINITLCADKRGKKPMHLISMFGNDNLIKEKLQSHGFSIRAAKKDKLSWRFETVRSNYGEVCLLATKIASLFDNANLIFRARLGGEKINKKEGNSLPQLPASSIMPGMALFTKDGYDIVVKKSFIKTNGEKVFDLDIENTHNYIANNIVTHNCIYTWRGASIKNLLHFEKDYAETKVIILEQNYRSTKNIIEAANNIIKKNVYRVPKILFTENVNGEEINICEAYDEQTEANFVAEKITELLKNNKNEEIAILYRANFQSRVLEEALLNRQIPYQVLGVKFFERKEIKDLLSYVKVAFNKDSLSDIKRIINVPARGIGKVTIVKIFANQIDTLPKQMQIKINKFYESIDDISSYIENHKTSESIKYIIEKSGIKEELSKDTNENQERLENIMELVTLSIKYDNLPKREGLEKLLEDAALASDQDSLMQENTGVRLMTVHASKGLEFKFVFVTGLEQDLFPHSRTGDRLGSSSSYNEAKEEERRLFYVAVTRAKEKLFLSYATIRTIFGMKQVNTPSEFIYDIPNHLSSFEQAHSINGEKIVYL